MKPIVTKLIVLVLVLSALLSFASCTLQSDIKSVTFNGETYYTGYLYEVRIKLGGNEGAKRYVYSTKSRYEGDKLTITQGEDVQISATVTDVVEVYSIFARDGISDCTIIYYTPFSDEIYTTLSEAKLDAPLKYKVQIDKERAEFIYYAKAK